MAHAAAHLKKARELEQCSEYKAFQKARERRRRQRERAERKRQVTKNLVLSCLDHVSVMFQQQRVFLLACVQGNCVWEMKAVWVTQLGCG